MGSKRSKIDPKNEAFEVVRRHGTEEAGWKKERLLKIKLLLEGEVVIDEVTKLLGRHRNRINDQALPGRWYRSATHVWRRLGKKGQDDGGAHGRLTEKLRVG